MLAQAMDVDETSRGRGSRPRGRTSRYSGTPAESLELFLS